MEKIIHLYSLKKLKSFFNINKTEEVVPVVVSLDPNKYVPAESPGIALKDDLLGNVDNHKYSFFGNNTKQLIPVLFPFPTKIGNADNLYTEIYYKNIHVLPQKNLITNHKVKSIDLFKIDKLKDIGKYVATNAAITFLIPDLLNAYNFWMGINSLCLKYKYTVFFNHLAKTPLRKFATDEFIPFISFIDISYCIPIFDRRKIDGMGVCCGFMYRNLYEKNRKTTIIETLYFVMSNHKANLIYLDGSAIRTPTTISSSILKFMVQTIKNELEYNKFITTKLEHNKLTTTKPEHNKLTTTKTNKSNHLKALFQNCGM